MECQYSERKKIGAREYLYCILEGDVCPFIKYCPTERKLINTEKHLQCVRLNAGSNE